MIDGIININKDKGFTSHDVIAKMRGMMGIRKMGHAGTLDPAAIGVLPICIGKATKLSEYIMDEDKTYEAIVKFGVVTDTQDITGEVLEESEVNINSEGIEETFSEYLGSYLQLPPMYSAIRVDGKRLYESAREGVEVERKKRLVEIHEIKLLSYDPISHEGRFLVDCGKGTYIRTLFHDIGTQLGCGATTKELIRTRVGEFHMGESISLPELQKLIEESTVENHVVSMDEILKLYPSLTVLEEHSKTIWNGNPLKKKAFQEFPKENDAIYDDLVRIYDYEDKFIALYKYNKKEKRYRPVKMFI